MADRTVIIDIDISSEEAVKKIKDSEDALKALKEQEKQLNEERKNATITAEEYYRRLTEIRTSMTDSKQTMSAYGKVLQQNVKAQKQNADSLDAMRLELSKLLKAYDALSKADREGAIGKEMLGRIQELTNGLNEAEQASGRFQRNVGNYKSALEGLPGPLGNVASFVSKLNSGFINLQGGVKGAIESVGGLAKAFVALLANPIVAVITAIVGVLKGLQEAFKRNDDASTKLAAALAPLKSIVDVVMRAFNALANVIATVVDWIGKAVTWIGNLVHSVGEFLGIVDESDASESLSEMEKQLVLRNDRLQDIEREYIVKKAENDREIAELNNKSLDREKYTLEERKGFLQEALDLEKQSLEMNRARMKERLELLKLEQKVRGDYSDEMKDKIAQATADMINAETEYNNATRRMFSRMQSFIDQERRAEEEAKKQQEAERRAAAARARAAADEARRRREAQQREEREQRKAVEDLTLAMMAEGMEKEIAIYEKGYERERAELVEKLNTDKTLTVKAREALNERLVLMEAKYVLEMAAIRDKYTMEEAQKEADRMEALAEKERSSEAERLALMTQLYQNALNERLNAARDNAVEMAKISEEAAQNDVEVAQQRLKELKALDADEIATRYATAEAYEKAIAEATGAVIEAQGAAAAAAENTKTAIDEVNKAVSEGQMGIASAIDDIAGNLNNLFESVSEQNESYKGAAKAMALMQLLLSSSVSIAKAVEGATAAAAATGPAAPFTLAGYIAEMVAVVTGAIAQARTIFQEGAAAFATGGVVRGPGSGTSDSIMARVSNGEAIMTAKATAMFYDQLSAMNVAGGGRPFDRSGGNKYAQGGVVSTRTLMDGRQMSVFSSMISEAMKEIQPVVSVKEITNVQNRVKTKEILSRQ